MITLAQRDQLRRLAGPRFRITARTEKIRATSGTMMAEWDNTERGYHEARAWLMQASRSQTPVKELVLS